MDDDELLGPVPAPAGRPDVHFDLGPLQRLLLLCCPADEKGRSSINSLAQKHLGVTPWAVFKWIKNNRVPPLWVDRLVELSDGRVKREDFFPYVFG